MKIILKNADQKIDKLHLNLENVRILDNLMKDFKHERIYSMELLKYCRLLKAMSKVVHKNVSQCLVMSVKIKVKQNKSCNLYIT